MPVSLGPLQPAEREARIEIIPLIDIMFFLLASFMLVSLNMINYRAVPVSLPTATTSTSETEKTFVAITVDKAGVVYLDRKPVGPNEMAATLAAQRKTNPNLRVFISGDKDARHGDVLRVLDLVRSAGIDKAAFEVRPISHPK